MKIILRWLGIVIGSRSNEREQDRKKNETMVETKDDDEEKDSEEDREHMRITASQQDEGNEGGEAPVEDSHAHVKDGCLGSLLPCPRDGEEGMTHVDTVVDQSEHSIR